MKSVKQMLETLLAVLSCPTCNGTLSCEALDDDRVELVCTACGLRAPVIRGVPRLAGTPDTNEARRTQASFGYEWTEFNDPEPSGQTNFQDYFAGLDLESLKGKLVLDAGCGMGRHARETGKYAGIVVAVDFSAAVDQAARNTASQKNVQCIQADLTRLPLRNESFDFVYSLGVLHHIADTEGALRGLVAKLKKGGQLRVYLYWKREGMSGWLLSCVSAVRLVTTRLPFPVLKFLCWVLSVLLFVGVIVPYRAALALGIRSLEAWPLFVYTKYPFQVLYNDQFDRFSAPIEKRYSPEEARQLLTSVGLTDVAVQACYGWVVDGTKPLTP
jgi:SAM-dependent methyltransferase